jgi:hypothetical protein
MGLKDNAQPPNVKINLRGSPHALGEEAPRGSRPSSERLAASHCHLHREAAAWNWPRRL